jgi:aryl-alcohol dehydrogenase-like predicted oxidoreductase
MIALEYAMLGGRLRASVIALGGWELGGGGGTTDQQVVDRIVGAALDAGITLIDTAQLYGSGRSESMIGRALRGRRARALIATKFRDFERWDKDDMLSRLKVSLQRLETDHVDIYQMHWPKKEMTPADGEAMTEGFTEAIRQGLTRYVGVSNFRVNHLRMVPAEGLKLIVANQIPYSLLWRTYDAEDTTSLCAQHGISLLAYSPLALGMLTGAYSTAHRPGPGPLQESVWTRKGIFEEAMIVVDRLSFVSEKCGRTPAQVALRWMLDRTPPVYPIIGTTKLTHLKNNLGALGWQLDAAEAEGLDRVSLDFQSCLDPSW